MNFTLDQLRAFLEVTRTGGVRKAAERLNITQPAVTARLKALEDQLGTALFDRTSGMRLTKSGDALLGYAEQYLELGSLIERDVASPDSFGGRFRIGVSETIVQSWLPDFVQRLRNAYPKLSIEIDVDISLALRDRLLENQIDVALLMGPVSDYRVENVELPEFRLSWFRACNAEIWNPAEGASVITFARDTRPFRSIKEELIQRYGPAVPIFPSSSLSACFRMVATGMGVGALPEALAEPYVQSGDIEAFDPGWVPEALSFTASYVSGPGSVLRKKAAALAQTAATAFS